MNPFDLTIPTKITKKINEWCLILNDKFGIDHIMNITLYGSQNYNIDTDTSDYDFKAIYVPSVEDALLKNPVSIELVNSKREHCEVKDIRLMCDMYKKQNINFLETLFTGYYRDNPIYRNSIDYLYTYRNRIARYNELKCLKSIAGQSLHTIKELENILEKTDISEEELHKARKKCANILFLRFFIDKYIDRDYSFDECIWVYSDDVFHYTPHCMGKIDKNPNYTSYSYSFNFDIKAIINQFKEDIFDINDVRLFFNENIERYFKEDFQYIMDIEPENTRFTIDEEIPKILDYLCVNTILRKELK